MGGRIKVNIVEPRGRRLDHQHYEDLLGAVALGAATPEERQAVLAHASACAACRAELAELYAAVTALPLALEDREPSPILRYRIQAAVQHDLSRDPDQVPEPGLTAAPIITPLPPAPQPIRRRSRAAMAWAAAALVLLTVSAGLLLWNLSLQLEDEPDETVDTIAVQVASPAPGENVRLSYLQDRGIFLLSVENLTPITDEQVYQVWLIGDKGPPTPVATFFDETGEVAVSADRSQYEALAVTVEPGPNGSPAPTSDPIIVAPLSASTPSTP